MRNKFTACEFNYACACGALKTANICTYEKRLYHFIWYGAARRGVARKAMQIIYFLFVCKFNRNSMIII